MPSLWIIYLTVIHLLALTGIAWTIAWLSHVISTRRDMAALERSALDEFEGTELGGRP
jgi:uncharacterized iron-regulated membrane protein